MGKIQLFYILTVKHTPGVGFTVSQAYDKKDGKGYSEADEVGGVIRRSEDL
jgi:hypothetical protein